MPKDDPPSLHELLAAERRRRLAAERLLECKQAELVRANKRLRDHAKMLSAEVIETRQRFRSVRNEAADLKGRNVRVTEDLQKANRLAVVAERRLWDALETIQDGFAVFNHRDQLLIANRAYLALFDGLDGIRRASPTRSFWGYCWMRASSISAAPRRRRGARACLTAGRRASSRR